MDKKQIESEIKAKKEAIKQTNRELSKLQDELKKSSAPLRLEVTKLYRTSFDSDTVILTVKGNKSLRGLSVLDFNRAIESLSDPVEPKSYVDWDKIPKEYNWVASSYWDHGHIIPYMYQTKPKLEDGVWINSSQVICAAPVYEYAFIGTIPCWRDSLIHRPGVKE